jgi:hypothetical protein
MATQISDQYRFTGWQATRKNDAWSCAHCGLRRVSPIAPTPAVSLATRRPCSHAGNVNLIRCYELANMAGLRFEPGSPGLESSALTTRPMRLA